MQIFPGSSTSTKKNHTFNIKWWGFSVSDGTEPPVKRLGDGDALRIWNRFLTGSHLKTLGLSLEQFFSDRWQELNQNAILRNYVSCGECALSQIPEAIRLLKREALY
jgi:hypothetical protein